MDDQLEVTERDGACVFRVWAKPRASRDAIGGVRAGALEVSLSAPPVDGAANAALVGLVARALGIPKRDVELVRGHESRDKILRVRGADADAIRALARG